MYISPIPGFSEPFSSLSHLISAGIFFILSFFLIYRGRGNNARVIGLLIYSFCLIFLLSMSGVYHLLEKGGTGNYVLRILDHTAIFGLISGTFTPIHLILFRGIHRWLVLTIVWTLSITGLTLTAVFFTQIPEWVSLLVFLFLGWIGLYSLWKIYHVHSKKILYLLLMGGIAYTLGAVIEFIQIPQLVPGIIGHHEIFHIFVVLGVSFHWRLIYVISKFPISSKITIVVRELPGNHFEAVATSEHVSFKAQSLEELKKSIMDWVHESYHEQMKPDLINFKFTKEEDVFL